MSVRRAADHFHRRPPSFKADARDAQTNVGSQLRTEAETAVGADACQQLPDDLVPASVPTRLKVPHRARFVPNVWALSADSGFGRSPRRRRSDGPTNQMHDDTTPASEIAEQLDQLTAQLTAINRVLLRRVKSKSPHGRGIYSDLTDLTDSLIGKDIQGRVCARARAPVSSASLASERIGKIGKIGARRRALMRFSVNRQQSNGVKSRLISSKIGGWSA